MNKEVKRLIVDYLNQEFTKSQNLHRIGDIVIEGIDFPGTQETSEMSIEYFVEEFLE